jgi:hypothetical protein
LGEHPGVLAQRAPALFEVSPFPFARRWLWVTGS